MGKPAQTHYEVDTLQARRDQLVALLEPELERLEKEGAQRDLEAGANKPAPSTQITKRA